MAFPIIGPAGNCPNLYIAVTHRGVTLAAILGKLVTQEILDRVSVAMLEPYRPSRFEKQLSWRCFAPERSQRTFARQRNYFLSASARMSYT